MKSMAKDLILKARIDEADANAINVTRALSWDSGEVKPPKTRNGVRRVPMPANLAAMLSAMRGDAPNDGLVFPDFKRFGENKAARKMRDHLALAGVTRTRLAESTSTLMPVGFRSLRDTGITWMALDGVPLATMQRRAGHDDMNTTMGYVKEAEDLGGTLGEPFGPLPGQLLAKNSRNSAFFDKNWSGRRDSNTLGVPASDKQPQVSAENEESQPAEEEQNAPITLPSGQLPGQVEEALALALVEATKAGQWELVAMLARQLEDRRRDAGGLPASSKVVPHAAGEK